MRSNEGDNTMTRRTMNVKAAVLVLALLCSLSFSADVRASLTPFLVGGAPTGPVLGVFTFSYDVLLSNDQKVNTGAVPGASVNTGVGVLGTTFASFFTIYDFAGLVAGSNTQPAGWTFENLLVGATPSTTVPTDQAGVGNLTWFWTGGPGTVLPTPGTLVGTFSAGSTFIGNPVLHNFTSGATKNTPTDPSTNNT